MRRTRPGSSCERPTGRPSTPRAAGEVPRGLPCRPLPPWQSRLLRERRALARMAIRKTRASTSRWRRPRPRIGLKTQLQPRSCSLAPEREAQRDPIRGGRGDPEYAADSHPRLPPPPWRQGCHDQGEETVPARRASSEAKCNCDVHGDERGKGHDQSGEHDARHGADPRRFCSRAGGGPTLRGSTLARNETARAIAPAVIFTRPRAAHRSSAPTEARAPGRAKTWLRVLVKLQSNSTCFASSSLFT